MGKWCVHASSLIFDRIIIKVAGNQDRHKSWNEFNFGPLVSMVHLYVFEMRFDLGTLDSGERSLPFGLLVFLFATTFANLSFWCANSFKSAPSFASFFASHINPMSDESNFLQDVL